ncbi:hypothetical protein FVE85_4654 [Porphyridium purpureum]|uniref:GPI inositol-deacylase n=1 Tax=Porphyridium purpureum TaxID=35688 RepID=A0A5J4YSW5_PORPP|nr:hypothetical protein FVE85_4654 [Porphyridium purpureum]|eukprot:POR7378..scf236_6
MLAYVPIGGLRPRRSARDAARVTARREGRQCGFCERARVSWVRPVRAANESTRTQDAARSKLGPCVIVPGLGNCTADYVALKQILEDQYSIPTEVVRVSRLDWVRNAKGFLLPSYWKGELEPAEVLGWFFERLDAQVLALEAQHGPDVKLTLIGHSAGGWLSRVYLGEVYARPSDLRVHDRFQGLVTLGTPHLPPPSGFLDQTRGLLSYATLKFPGAHHQTDGIKYLCVGSSAVQGDTSFKWDLSAFIETFIAYWSYLPLCGNGAASGDGIVPVDISFLDGAKNIDLESVRHSPLTDKSNWYGTQQAVEYWMKEFMALLQSEDLVETPPVLSRADEQSLL